jgi:hypothetical protein
MPSGPATSTIAPSPRWIASEHASGGAARRSAPADPARANGIDDIRAVYAPTLAGAPRGKYDVHSLSHTGAFAGDDTASSRGLLDKRRREDEARMLRDFDPGELALDAARYVRTT